GAARVLDAPLEPLPEERYLRVGEYTGVPSGTGAPTARKLCSVTRRQAADTTVAVVENRSFGDASLTIGSGPARWRPIDRSEQLATRVERFVFDLVRASPERLPAFTVAGLIE